MLTTNQINQISPKDWWQVLQDLRLMKNDKPSSPLPNIYLNSQHQLRLSYLDPNEKEQKLSIADIICLSRSCFSSYTNLMILELSEISQTYTLIRDEVLENSWEKIKHMKRGLGFASSKELIQDELQTISQRFKLLLNKNFIDIKTKFNNAHQIFQQRLAKWEKVYSPHSLVYSRNPCSVWGSLTIEMLNECEEKVSNACHDIQVRLLYLNIIEWQAIEVMKSIYKDPNEQRKFEQWHSICFDLVYNIACVYSINNWNARLSLLTSCFEQSIKAKSQD